MATKIFNLSLPVELVKVIEEQAKLHFSSRNEYIKYAIIARLKSEGIENAATIGKYRTPEEMRRAQLKEFLAEHGITPITYES